MLEALRASGPWLAVRVLERALCAAGVRRRRVVLFRRDAIAGGMPPGVLRVTSARELAAVAAPEDCWTRLEPLLPREATLRRLEAGDELLAIASPPGALLCRVWLHARGRFPVPEVRRELVLGPDEAWLYDGVTAPAARGRGFFRRLLLGACAAAGARSCRTVLVGARDWNRASRRAIERAGFSVCGSLDLLARG